jgi:hypothetical protein
MNYQGMAKRLTIIILLSTTIFSLALAWGEWGHKHINRAAIFALPDSMRIFFYNHADFITEESVVPDIRKHTINDKAEGARHFIDIEDYNKGPIDNLPRTSTEARAKYDSSFMQKNGILPWYIQDMMIKLTKAFKDKRKSEILFLAADLGHYLGDANMPLHTSSNHDGQLTGQKGIHAFWEAQLPEQFGTTYDLNVGQAVYISDITLETWNIISHTHMLADTLLLIERNVKATFQKDKIFKTDSAGNIMKNIFGQPIHTSEYAIAVHTAMKGMVQSQMRHAIKDIANYWYTAWVNAGRPNLQDLDSPALTDANTKQYKKEIKLWNKGKLIEIGSLKEF